MDPPSSRKRANEELRRPRLAELLGVFAISLIRIHELF
jgi:hypothetical protein